MQLGMPDGPRWRSFDLRALAWAWMALAWTALGGAAEREPREQSRSLSNPVPLSDDAVREGRRAYLRLCQYCHGPDGRAQANPDFEAPSLRDPRQWSYGSSDGELFVSIRDGAGHEMPPFGGQLADAEIWKVVHFLRSIGPRAARPGARGDP